MKPAALKSTSTVNTARRFFLAARALAALAMAAVIVPGAIPAPALAATPQVTNVLAIQRPGTKLVDVTYDVYDADGHAMTVALYISPDGGVSFPIQGVTVTGGCRCRHPERHGPAHRVGRGGRLPRPRGGDVCPQGDRRRWAGL